MAEKNISFVFSIKNDNFNANIKAMNQQMKTFENEIKQASNNVVTSSNKLEALGQKYNAISKSIDGAKNKVEAYKQQIDKQNQAIEKSKDKLSELAYEKTKLNQKIAESTNKYGDELTKLKELDTQRSKLTNQIDKAKSKYGEESQEVQKLQKQLDKLNEEYDNIVEAQGDGIVEASKYADELKKLNTEQQKAEKMLTSQEKSLHNYEVGLSNAETEVSNLETSLRNCNEEILRQSNNFLKASEDLQKTSDKMKKIGGSIDDVSTKVLNMSTAVLTGVGAIGKMYMDTEENFQKVNTLANLSDAEFTKYKESAIQSSNELGVSINDYNEAIYNAMSSGIDFANSQEFVNNANKLAVGGFTDVTKAVDVLTTIINAYGLEAEDSAKISDILINVQNKGKVTVDQLASSMGNVIPTANLFSVNLENVGTAYAIMTSQGITAEVATTQINSTLNELGDSGSQVAGILMEKTGKSFKQLMDEGYSLGDVLKIIQQYANENGIAFNDLWSSQEAMKGSTALLNETFGTFNDVMNDSIAITGSTQDAYDKMTDTSEYKLKKAINELKNSFIQLGEGATPLIEGLSEAISKLADFISNLDPKLVETVGKFAVWGVAIGGVGKAVGSTIEGIGGFMGTLGKLFGVLGEHQVASQLAGEATGVLGNALGDAVGTAGGLTTALGGATGATSGFSGALSGLSPLAGALFSPAGLIAAGVVAVGGLAWGYKELNEKLDENGQKLVDATNNWDNFEGRVRTGAAGLDGIFGEEIEIKFTDNIDEIVANVEEEQKTLIENWASYYADLHALESGEYASYEEYLQAKEQMEQEHADTIAGINNHSHDITKEQLEAQRQAYKQYLMEELGMTEEAATRKSDLWVIEANEKAHIYNANAAEILDILASCNGDIESLDAESKARLQELEAENVEIKSTYLNEDVSNMHNALKAKNVAEATALEESKQRNNAYHKDVYGQMQEHTKNQNAEIDKRIENLDRWDFASEEDYEAEKQRLENMKSYNQFFSDAFGNEMDRRIASGESFSAASSHAFAEFVRDVESGRQDISQFGMTSEQAYAQAIIAMAEAGATSEELTDAIMAIPKDKRAQVIANIPDTSRSDNLRWSIENLQDKDVTVTYNERYVTTYETYGVYIDPKKGAMRRATGDPYTQGGLYLTSEKGWELIDSPNEDPVPMLAQELEGDLSYIPTGSRITTHLNSTAQMRADIQTEVSKQLSQFNNSDLTEIVKAIYNQIKNQEDNEIIVTNNNTYNVTPKTEYDVNQFETDVETLILKDLRRFGKVKGGGR
mgnify:CR=1 FL=1